MPIIIPAVAAGGNVNFSAGTSSAALSSIVFSNSNGVSFGLNGSTMTASAAAGGGVTPALSGSNGSFSFSTATFGNLNGLSFYTSNGSFVASHNALTTAMASNRGSDFVQATAAFAGTSASGTIASNGISVSIGPYITTGALSNHSHGNPQLNLTNLSGTTASNSAGFTLSLSAAAPGGGVTPALSGSNGSFSFSTATFGNLNGLSFYTSNGSFVASHNGLTTAAASDHSHGNPTLNLTNLSGTTASNSAGFTLSLSAAAPGGGAGVTMQRFEVIPMITGTGASSHAPASWWFNPMILPAALTFSNLMVLKSFSLSAPTATSQASSGRDSRSYTHGITIFNRINFSNSSTQLTTVTTASFGMSVSFSFTSVSQTATYSWVTNTTGGTSSFTTTSNASNHLLFFQSARLIAIPMQSSLSAGEYFIAHRHSTTAATAGGASFGFLVSNIHIAPQSVTFKRLGISVAGQSSSSNPTAGIGFGIASAVTITSTMAASVISAITQQYWYANFINSPVET